jgi:glycosyltransferase involved in cell wall biosynthesis
VNLLETIEERAGEGQPEVSVLMPVYSTEALVGAAVASILGQQGCVAEILISDDRSADGTLAAVRRSVAGWKGRHHVRILRATRRLAIDHLGALVSLSSAPLLVQAHGDDVSHPERLARLLAIHRKRGASLITSLANVKVGGRIVPEPMPQGWSKGRIALSAFLETPNRIMSGARYALDRRVFEAFPRLDSDYLEVGHDALQAFRATLLGGVWLSPRHLVSYARRPEQWSSRMIDGRHPASIDFGLLLRRLEVMRAARRDLEHAERQRSVPAERIDEARALLGEAFPRVAGRLLDAAQQMRRLGRVPFWVTQERLARRRAGKK